MTTVEKSNRCASIGSSKPLRRPRRGVNDLKELTGARVEDEDGAVDGLGHQIALRSCAS